MHFGGDLVLRFPSFKVYNLYTYGIQDEHAPAPNVGRHLAGIIHTVKLNKSSICHKRHVADAFFRPFTIPAIRVLKKGIHQNPFLMKC